MFDPFVGTGSILVACAERGALCFGSDLDIRVLKGYGVGRLSGKAKLTPEVSSHRADVFLNFRHYGLPFPEILVMDVARPLLRLGLSFDAVICDPPYGVRARS